MVNHTARYTISLFFLGKEKALSAFFCLVFILTAFPGPIPAVLTDDGRIERGWLGVEISDITPQIQQDLHLKNRAGALVRHVVKGGPAENAGLLQGDVITQVNSYSVFDSRGLVNKINEIAPGKTVALRFIRNGSTYKTQAILGKRPSRSASGKASRAETDYQENEKFLELLGKKPSGKEPPAVDESELADRRAVHEALERELFNNSELGNKGTSRENKGDPGRQEFAEPDSIPRHHMRQTDKGVDLQIRSLVVEPSRIKGGDEYDFTVDLEVEDPEAASGKELAVGMRFKVLEGGASLFTSKYQEHDCPNGRVCTLQRVDLPSSTEPGEYWIEVICSYQGRTDRERAGLVID